MQEDVLTRARERQLFLKLISFMVCIENIPIKHVPNLIYHNLHMMALSQPKLSCAACTLWQSHLRACGSDLYLTPGAVTRSPQSLTSSWRTPRAEARGTRSAWWEPTRGTAQVTGDSISLTRPPCPFLAPHSPAPSPHTGSRSRGLPTPRHADSPCSPPPTPAHPTRSLPSPLDPPHVTTDATIPA